MLRQYRLFITGTRQMRLSRYRRRMVSVAARLDESEAWLDALEKHG